MNGLTIIPCLTSQYGGVALLQMPQGMMQSETVVVSVLNDYSKLWLAPTEGEGDLIHVGEGNWQPTRHAFGPYPVVKEANMDTVRVGPEIVNKLENFVPLTIVVGGREFSVNWPDNVVPRVGTALRGGISGIARPNAGDFDTKRLVGRQKAAQDESRTVEQEPYRGADDITAEVADTEIVPDDPPLIDANQRPKLPLRLLGILLVVLVASMAAAFFFLGQAPQKQIAGEDSPQPQTQPTADCSFAGLAATPGGFVNLATALSNCGEDVTGDTALRLVEAGTARSDSNAWLMLGTLYDAAMTDPLFETRLGVSFLDNPGLAAEYYKQAANAGSVEAGARLRGTCGRLQGLTDTLSQGAFDDYCQ